MGADITKKGPGIDEPAPTNDVRVPTEELKRTSPEREHQIKKLQEKFGLSREIAERMVDESRGTL
ncbi:MAG: hypothetical protein P8182_17140 [Deltaproteobacteria bacterium]